MLLPHVVQSARREDAVNASLDLEDTATLRRTPAGTRSRQLKGGEGLENEMCNNLRSHFRRKCVDFVFVL